MYELLEPLLGGCPCVVLDEAVASNVEELLAAVRACGITRLLLVPSFLRAAFGHIERLPEQLRLLVLMGEAVDPSLARAVLDAAPRSARIVSIYGSTEASSALVSDLRDWTGERFVPLGSPIDPSVMLRVLDDEGRVARPMAVGHLHLSGPLLFEGYAGEPPPTDGSAGARGRSWDTGDMVRLHHDGSLEFLGRRDHLVKVRGFRVHLGEIERAALACPPVSGCAAVVHTDPAGFTTVTAFVTPSGVDDHVLIEHLRSSLSAPAVPSRVHTLDVLPLTSSGKVDRQELARRLQP
jgi:acyl-coenzyme A synthetase/AMP-(fatty) acid ligase